MDRRAWTLLLALGAVWGSSYLLIKVGLSDFSPAVIVCARVALGAVVLIPLAVHRRALGSLRGRAGLVCLLAAAQVAGPFLLIAWGEGSISSALTGILVATTPLFTALIAIRIDEDERVRGRGVVGLLAGFAGVGLIIGFDVSADSAATLGALAVLVAAFGYSIGGFIVKRGSTGTNPIDPVALAAATMVISTALTLIPAGLSLPTETPGLVPTATLLILGLAGTGVSFALFNILLVEVGPAKTSIVTYIVPGFALLYGVLLLDEALTPAALAGLAMIALGSWLTTRGTGRPSPTEERALP